MLVHARSGLYFRRVDNGCVELIKRVSDADDAAVQFRLTISPTEWAVLVASLSYRGETAETFMAAFTLHCEKQSKVEAQADVEAALTAEV